MTKQKIIYGIIFLVLAVSAIVFIPKYIKQQEKNSFSYKVPDTIISDKYNGIKQKKKKQAPAKKKKINKPEPKKEFFEFKSTPEIDNEEIERQKILSMLVNASFHDTTTVTPKGDFERIDEYQTPEQKSAYNPYITDSKFPGMKRNEASARVNLTRTIVANRMISITLKTAINSHLKGKVFASIEHDVYAAHGDNILIPKGSKCVGWYIPLKKIGDERLAISWTRITTPAGVNINLKAPSADVMGRSGAIGEIDSRFWDRYGLALTTSTATNTISYIATTSTGTKGGTENTEEKTRNDMISDYKDDLTSMTNQLFKERIKIKPSMNIDAGARMHLMPIDDIWFPQAENNNINVALIHELQSNTKGEN
ncbi:MAG: hypothetical protein DRG78_00760 [Epsilonproteobacteria bacterium]|nr:MAG: hypothetical protein DRG78_00760 [Campylobacterota bacterium]